MKKRLFALTLLAAMALPTVAQAKTVEFVLDKPDMRVSENYEILDSTLLAAPFILNDRTMVPVRALSEQYGAEVGWDAATRTVSVKTENTDIKLTIDDTTAYVNGEAATLDAPPVIYGDITFIPVRFVTENMGFYVNFVPRTRSILVTDQKPFSINGTPLYDYELDGLYYMYATQLDPEQAAMVAYNLALQNTIFAEEARKENMSLTEENDALIDQLLADEPYPALLDGVEAYIFENDLLRMQYIALLADRYKDDPAVLAYYEENYLSAKHILISGTEEASKKKADEVYKKAKNTKDFDALVKEYGEDPGMQTNPDGYVFTSGEMVPTFEEGAKALEPGEISKPILSEYGYHIIKREPLPVIPDDALDAIITKLYIVPAMENAVIE